ncbi:serine threonine kinase [Pyrrhoderma noxium]|uniref:Serine threonine kinase n=1 Tax=Pyrrhoderma noxium TaxID=2282107 RepID=A0A286UUB3_9AGAM|nr:serine threonine kinase [Pyrrhoderma noxium]
MPSPLQGLKFEKWLGQGGNGTVGEYHVPEKLSGNPTWKNLVGMNIAIKLIPHSQSFIYEHEKKRLEILPDSKGVMKYYGAIEGTHNNFLLMELGKYGSLFDNLKDIISSSAQDIIIIRIRCISRCTLLGLMSLHDANIVHQDLKPENIVVKELTETKIGCFISDIGSAHLSHIDTTPTRLLTTYTYAAPEQIDNIFGRKESDIWSLGLCLVAASLGREPFAPIPLQNDAFKSVKDGTLLRRIIKESFLFKIPAAEDLLLGMLAKDPKDRFTAKEAYSHPFVQNKQFIRPLRKAANRPPPNAPDKENPRSGFALAHSSGSNRPQNRDRYQQKADESSRGYSGEKNSKSNPTNTSLRIKPSAAQITEHLGAATPKKKRVNIPSESRMKGAATLKGLSAPGKGREHSSAKGRVSMADKHTDKPHENSVQRQSESSISRALPGNKSKKKVDTGLKSKDALKPKALKQE